MMTVILKIRLNYKLFKIYYICYDELIFPDGTLQFLQDGIKSKFDKCLKCVSNGYFYYLFVNELLNSDVYRTNVINNMYRLSESHESEDVLLKLNLNPPQNEIIDYLWNDKLLRLVWSRIEIENAFSWLSTLGGAYSALGDTFQYCAEEAGRIAIRQYKLSCMLGDKSLAARSKVYTALSHSQKGNLKIARHIIRNVAAFARESNDVRLLRMCQGVWAKLKYLREKKHKLKNGAV